MISKIKSFRNVKSSIPRNKSTLPRINISLGFGNIDHAPRHAPPPSFKLHGKYGAPKEAQEKIPIETLKSWVIDELSFLKEEKGKVDFCNGKAKLLLDFLPEIFRDEILKLFGGQDET